MSLTVSRAVLRRSQFAVRRATIRNASTNSEVAGSAKEKASQAASKASEGLSRVTSSAGSAIIKAGQFTSSALGGIGGRTGRLIGFVQCQYYFARHHTLNGLDLRSIKERELPCVL